MTAYQRQRQKQNRAGIIVIVCFIVTFTAMVVFAYIQTLPPVAELMQFISIPEITVPLYDENGNQRGNLTVALHVELEEGYTASPESLIHNVQDTLQSLTYSDVTSQGSVERLESRVLSNLNANTDVTVKDVFVFDMHTSR